MLHIITDSGSMLSAQEAQDLRVSVAPFTVTLNGAHPQKEILEISPDEFLASVRSGLKPASAAPAPGSFLEAINSHCNNDIIIITTGHFLSGSYNSACTARDMAKNPHKIKILDSQSISGPLRGLVIAAAKLAQAGKSLEETLTILEDMREVQVSFLSPSNINFLAEGGRIPRSSVPVAKMLKAIPILTFMDSTIKKHAIKLGFDAVVKSCITGILKRCPDTKLDFYVHHSGIPEVASRAVEQLKAKFPGAQVDCRMLFPVGITHAGPDALVIQALKHLEL